MRHTWCGVCVAVAAVLTTQAAYAQWTWTPQTGRWVNLKQMPKETPELQIEYARSLMVDGDYKKALRETYKFDNFYAKSELADQNLFLRGEIDEKRGADLEAAREFQKVLTTHPNTSLYEAAIKKQYEIGDRFYERGEQKMAGPWWKPFKKSPFKNAIKVYTMVIDNQPFTASAAEAQYKVGLCHYTREEYEEAAFEYKRVIEDYSGSKWVNDACYGLAECYYDASLPAEYDQVPSQLAIDAIDDFSQRYPSDQKVKDLAEKRKEMRDTIAEQRLEIANFYAKRRQFDAARIYYNVVVDQFAETPSAEAAREWLSENAPRQASAADSKDDKKAEKTPAATS